MGDHESSIGLSDEWYTPPELINNLGLEFDLDPCSPGIDHWIPANKVYTKKDNGLKKPWEGLVFMNPPFGNRNGAIPWLIKFIIHGNGIGLVPARTSSGWFHDFIPRMEAIYFPRGKTKFINDKGIRGKFPGFGIVMFSIGDRATNALLSMSNGIALRL